MDTKESFALFENMLQYPESQPDATEPLSLD